jgi:hypothetical protein
MAEFLMSLSFYEWLGLGMFLLIVELTVVGTGHLLWLGIAALVVAGLQYVTGGMLWPLQYLLFGVLAVLGVVLWKLLSGGRPVEGREINNPSASLLGLTCRLHEAIAEGRGKVRLRDSVWIVAGDDLPAGCLVKVVGLDGAVLMVSPVAEQLEERSAA